MSHKFLCPLRKLSIYICAPAAHPFSRRPAGVDSKTDPRGRGIVRKNRRKTRHEEGAHCNGHFGLRYFDDSSASGPSPGGGGQESDVRAGRITEEPNGLGRILRLLRRSAGSGAGRGPLKARCTGQRLLARWPPARRTWSAGPNSMGAGTTRRVGSGAARSGLCSSLPWPTASGPADHLGGPEPKGANAVRPPYSFCHRRIF